MCLGDLKGASNTVSGYVGPLSDGEVSLDNTCGEFILGDTIDLMTLGMGSICFDDFTVCFEPRTSCYAAKTQILRVLHIVGIFTRYFVLFPIRLCGMFLSMAIFFLAVPFVSCTGSSRFKNGLFFVIANIWIFCVSAHIRHHGRKPVLTEPHLFVANHTSFIDFVLMSSYVFPHSIVAQIHGGLLGCMQYYMLPIIGSLTFHIKNRRDRQSLFQRLREHVMDVKNTPIIVFPEGTCVNNEYTVLFHRGAFDLGVSVCPVAIKYNKEIMDPYWNTREQTFSRHAFYLMTRWFMIVDIWWMDPEHIMPGESSVEFAERVKAKISCAAGLKSISWDGYYKNVLADEEEEKLKKSFHLEYISNLRDRMKGFRNTKKVLNCNFYSSPNDSIHEDIFTSLTNRSSLEFQTDGLYSIISGRHRQSTKTLIGTSRIENFALRTWHCMQHCKKGTPVFN